MIENVTEQLTSQQHKFWACQDDGQHHQAKIRDLGSNWLRRRWEKINRRLT